MLAEFGTTVDPDIEIRVWDSTSEMRYLVLPQRPQGTQDWTQAQLATLVSRNAMIGVEKAQQPQDGTAA